MHRYAVPSMTCGHCAGTIERAVKGVDPQATVKINLAAKEVTIQSTADDARLAAAIRDAGYESQRLGT
ncbi:heavy-metal-associated domain-containing protein [Vineibacter terrae]|uniref:Heavy-metal-associated domain-containing protein n=1 Tax=Vineibacter terrae TaxID=2586908 RepID=A0A5C8PU80_9HYPH|nr:heavy-metal-associated domain-containing protein [Vineibacter terrae]TXL80398.1 heavy-metal-associated domain-containing protein [Vineibacter terrae]